MELEQPALDDDPERWYEYEGASWNIPMSVPKVFLSYTSRFSRYPSKSPFAKAAADAIQKAGCLCVDMTGFGARTNPPPETCSKEVEGCDIYVGIFGPFFGSPIPSDNACSYTMLEFQTAVNLGKPLLIFFLSNSYPWPLNDHRESDYCYTAQQVFLKSVREGKMYSYESFANPDALGRLVYQSLIGHRIQHTIPSLTSAKSANVAPFENSSSSNTPSKPEVTQDDTIMGILPLMLQDSKLHDAARTIIEWSATTNSHQTTAMSLARLFLDTGKPFYVRSIAAALAEDMMKKHGSNNIPSTLFDDSLLTRQGILEFASKMFELVPAVMARKNYQCEDVVIPMLSLMDRFPSEPISIVAGRVLYALAGANSDKVGKWKPPHEEPTSQQIFDKVLLEPSVDPLTARYALFLRSRCRDVSSECDLVYEIAYSADKGYLPPSELFSVSMLIPDDLLDWVVKKYFANPNIVGPDSVTLFLARMGWRSPLLALQLTSLLTNEHLNLSSSLIDEIWQHILKQEDLKCIKQYISVTKKKLPASGKIALAWLSRSSVDQIEQIVHHESADRVELIQTIKELVGAWAKDNPVSDSRLQDPPTSRSYGEIGPFTASICRSRKEQMFLVRGNDITKRMAWYYVLISMPARDRFEIAASKGQVDLTSYGTIIRSGYGADPPDDTAAWMKQNYDFTPL